MKRGIQEDTTLFADIFQHSNAPVTEILIKEYSDALASNQRELEKGFGDEKATWIMQGKITAIESFLIVLKRLQKHEKAQHQPLFGIS